MRDSVTHLNEQNQINFARHIEILSYNALSLLLVSDIFAENPMMRERSNSHNDILDLKISPPNVDHLRRKSVSHISNKVKTGIATVSGSFGCMLSKVIFYLFLIFKPVSTFHRMLLAFRFRFVM